MSLDEISYLDFTPDVGAGLRERALHAYAQQRPMLEHRLLLNAARRIGDVLDVVNPTNVRVEPKCNNDGDGEVFCTVDGMQFRATVTYPSGGGEEPTSVVLAVKGRGSQWFRINSLEDLGRHLHKGGVVLEDAS